MPNPDYMLSTWSWILLSSLDQSLHTCPSTTQRLSIKNAESVSPHKPLHNSETQREECWVCLSAQKRVLAHLLSRLVTWSFQVGEHMSHQSNIPLHYSSTLQVLILLRLAFSHTDFLIAGWVAVWMTTAIAARSRCTVDCEHSCFVPAG